MRTAYMDSAMLLGLHPLQKYARTSGFKYCSRPGINCLLAHAGLISLSHLLPKTWCCIMKIDQIHGQSYRIQMFAIKSSPGGGGGGGTLHQAELLDLV